MISLIKTFSCYANITAISCLVIISFFYYLRHRNRQRLLLCIGILVMALGTLLQRMVPFAKVNLDEFGKMISSSGPPFLWYIGSMLTSVGLIVIVIAFSLMTFVRET